MAAACFSSDLRVCPLIDVPPLGNPALNCAVANLYRLSITGKEGQIDDEMP
jgi:hypothetical protein